jgi:hypothetical protein
LSALEQARACAWQSQSECVRGPEMSVLLRPGEQALSVLGPELAQRALEPGEWLWARALLGV